ncbi:hypothetical protein CMEL01_05108 [Colletotrichum melonis]|uniref:Uncharacterized protein n=1 Tax=Colletotrichum melonis TaxID=1209925 RepID=A0AAI9XLK7_9PEZI|nr:hypothetical protein CMEL01_05108 [Colletotrichum melonis]
MNLTIELPNLPPWAQQFTGILPLTALIEFIEEAAKLHVFELSELTPAWCWPISPKGARVLLSTDDTTNACCLDRPCAVPTLHCMDAKFGLGTALWPLGIELGCKGSMCMLWKMKRPMVRTARSVVSST